MELSPGVELVWWLASREALKAQVSAVEPDHFFCALLAFAEMTDGELDTVATLDLAQEKLVEQRDKLLWHLRLRGLDTYTTELRHAVRAAAPHGEGEGAGATLHRSQAALKVFDAAFQLARAGREKLAPQHLLYALLEAPTPALSQALTAIGAPVQSADLPLPETLVAHTAAPPDTPALDRYTRRIVPATEPEAAVADGLRAALAAETRSPRLLVCAPGIPLWALIAAAAQSVPPPGRVAAVILADVPRETWPGLLAEARRASVFLLVDLTGQKPAVVEHVVALLAEVLKDADGVLVAVEVEHYHKYIQLKPEWANAFNPLWL